MEEQFNRTLEILKKQKNNIILELEKPEIYQSQIN